MFVCLGSVVVPLQNFLLVFRKCPNFMLFSISSYVRIWDKDLFLPYQDISFKYFQNRLHKLLSLWITQELKSLKNEFVLTTTSLSTKIVPCMRVQKKYPCTRKQIVIRVQPGINKCALNGFWNFPLFLGNQGTHDKLNQFFCISDKSFTCPILFCYTDT